MSMEIKGKVVQLLPMATGQGKKGQWKKQEFILETPGQYPKKVCLSIWGDKIDQFGLTVGDQVNVSVDLESREYNGRWYTEARAWKLEKSGGSSPAYNNNDIPVGDEPFGDTSGASDDLPF
jgi:hypothetical protein